MKFVYDKNIKKLLKNRYAPELFVIEDEKDKQQLIKAIKYYIKKYKMLSEEYENEDEENNMPGYREYIRNNPPDVTAYNNTKKKFPEIVDKYFIGFSRIYGQEAPHGMGRYDRYGGL